MAGRGVSFEDQWAKHGHQDCARWLFRVWDRRTRRRVSKAFASKAEGWVWAQAVQVQIGAGKLSAGSLSFAAVAEDYARQLDQRGVRDVHAAEVRRVAKALADAGIDNLRGSAPELADRVRTWLTTVKPFAKGRERPLSPITRNRWLRHVKSIGLHAVRHHGLPSNPFAAVQPLIVPEKLKATLRLDELRSLFATAFWYPADPYLLPVAFMVYAGLRRGEALHVRWEWIDFEARTITVRVLDEYRLKRGKERVVTLQDELAELLWRWPWRERSGWCVPDASLRQPRDAREHWEQFRAYLARCGVEPRDLHPHACRHTWVALQLATGQSVTRVRREAGHTELETTDGYSAAEAQYTTAVAGWPRGQFRLLPRPELADDADALGELRAAVGRGLALPDLAAAAGVPLGTLDAWLRGEVPEAVRQWHAVRAAAARLAPATVSRAAPLVAAAVGAPFPVGNDNPQG